MVRPVGREYLNYMIGTSLYSRWLLAVCSVQNNSSSLYDMPHFFPVGSISFATQHFKNSMFSALVNQERATRAHITNCCLDSMPDAHTSKLKGPDPNSIFP